MKIWDALKSAMRAFIPKCIGNGVLVAFLEILNIFQKIFGKKSESYDFNEKAFKNHLKYVKESSGFIEDQSKYFDMKFGKTTIAYAGCEIIACYNAINALKGRYMSFPDVIRFFEADGMMLSGKFGTSPKAILRFFLKNNYAAEMTYNRKKFDQIGQQYEALILTMYNDSSNIMQEIHTVNITKNKGFYAHNLTSGGRPFGPYDTVSELIAHANKGKAKGISLIGVKLT